MFGHNSEPVTLSRNCPAVRIPSGEAVELPAGGLGYITQALGGSFTVYIDGNLFRISGTDADALGKEPVEPIKIPENASDADIEALLWAQMKTCFDPEIPIDVVELGLIYECNLQTLDDGRRRVDVQMTLTAPGCGMGDVLVEDVRSKLLMIPTIDDVFVDLVFDPPWNHSMMSEEARLRTGMMY